MLRIPEPFKTSRKLVFRNRWTEPLGRHELVQFHLIPVIERVAMAVVFIIVVTVMGDRGGDEQHG